jgi:hypothetical protein
MHPIRMDGKALGVLPMSKGFALILACGASLFSFGVQASPILFAPMQKAASDIILVWDWCGLGFHRGPYGYCHRNGTVVVVPPVVVAPSPVVIAPSPVVVPAAPVVVAPIVCPSGYYLGPYGRCLLY